LLKLHAINFLNANLYHLRVTLFHAMELALRMADKNEMTCKQNRFGFDKKDIFHYGRPME